jgi:hypothetical protein
MELLLSFAPKRSSLRYSESVGFPWLTRAVDGSKEWDEEVAVMGNEDTAREEAKEKTRSRDEGKISKSQLS